MAKSGFLLPTLTFVGTLTLTACAATGQSSNVQSAASSAAAQSALETARAALGEAKSLQWEWRDTGTTLGSAEEALAAGDSAKAIKLSAKVESEVGAMVNQYYIEAAKPLLDAAQGRSSLTAAQRSTLEDAAAALSAAQGKKAYELINRL